MILILLVLGYEKFVVGFDLEFDLLVCMYLIIDSFSEMNECNYSLVNCRFVLLVFFCNGNSCLLLFFRLIF